MKKIDGKVVFYIIEFVRYLLLKFEILNVVFEFKFLYVLEGMNVFFGWLFFIVLFM